MEILLNMVWMLLVLPAWWLWRRCARGQEIAWSPWQCLFALAGLLVLLFPVISASDDLNAMRAEMEESTRTAVSASASEVVKSSSVGAMQAAMPADAPRFSLSMLGWLGAEASAPSGHAATRSTRSGRAPPQAIV